MIKEFFAKEEAKRKQQLADGSATLNSVNKTNGESKWPWSVTCYSLFISSNVVLNHVKLIKRFQIKTVRHEYLSTRRRQVFYHMPMYVFFNIRYRYKLSNMLIKNWTIFQVMYYMELVAATIKCLQSEYVVYNSRGRHEF